MDNKTSERHLTDADFFSLAVPAAGEPEVLPRHLSECQSCSHSLQEWKASVQAVAEEEVDAINRRSPEEWNAAADATMARVRKAARPGSRRRQTLRWAVGVAASLLVLALAIPRHGATTRPAVIPADAAGGLSADSGGLSAGDREDDRLLRDVAFLAQGDDSGPSLGPDDSL